MVGKGKNNTQRTDISDKRVYMLNSRGIVTQTFRSLLLK